MNYLRARDLVLRAFSLSNASMNALWLNRMSAYLHSDLRIASAKALVGKKIARETVLLKRYGRTGFSPEPSLQAASSIGDILLCEARAARHFWHEFRTLIPPESGFSARVPHAPDPVNRLLDIGYHHLANEVRKILNAHAIPTELGLLHVARTAKGQPLVYDLMELFRADIVAGETLRFIRLKKKRPFSFEPKDIPPFLARVNVRLSRRFYLAPFRSCRTYRYYMELQVLKLVRAINHREVFNPVSLPVRHESRCRCLTDDPGVLDS